MPVAVPLDLSRLRVFPLEQRRSLTTVNDIWIEPESPAPPVSVAVQSSITRTVAAIVEARRRNAQVILMYGAHLLRNGAAGIVARLLEQGWVTHLATNGAGSIHDWEYAWLGRSTESVAENVMTGTFGTWAETGHNLNLALLTGALEGLGYGRAVGRFLVEDGCHLPDPRELERLIRDFPADPMGAAAADLLTVMQRFKLPPGQVSVLHRWKHASIFAEAYRLGIPLTVHPGIGYDIISCHPMFHGAAVGRAAGEDFRLFAGAVNQLDGGVLLSVGSAIMAPQVFEKSLSCVHNLRFQSGRPAVRDHHICVVDLQDGGNWDWTVGEPPKTNPAYYLRFCKSFSRMGGTMQYLQCDNRTFVHHLWNHLKTIQPPC